MEELIGRTIKSITFENEGDRLVFVTDLGKIIYEAYGDCCSRSFFSDITGSDNLIGERVVTVEERQEWSEDEVKKAESQGNYESLSLYGYLIKTEKGTCDIEFRNDSNGYYGGWCVCVTNETIKNASN